MMVQNNKTPKHAINKHLFNNAQMCKSVQNHDCLHNMVEVSRTIQFPLLYSLIILLLLTESEGSLFLFFIKIFNTIRTPDYICSIYYIVFFV